MKLIADKGEARLSTQFGLSFKVCRGIHGLLTEDTVSDLWSSQAQERISSLGSEHSFRVPEEYLNSSNLASVYPKLMRRRL
jgi:hypothetical protein